MPLSHPVYRNPPWESDLSQGDILIAEKLHVVLLGHQDYFASQAHFRHFVVLTQSCDLDRNREVADFLTLAVVRHMSEAIGRRHVDIKDNLRQLLRELLLHQYNKRGFFYLPCDHTQGIEADSVVDLRVTFSLHRDHYDALLLARCGAMSPVYAAQLGSLFGHMFNRVATSSWQEIDSQVELGERVKQTLSEIEARENSRLATVLKDYGGICCIAGCGRAANTYRWIRFAPAYSLVSNMECPLCRDHAKMFDRNGLPKDTKIRWPVAEESNENEA